MLSRVLVRVSESELVPVDPADIYLLEAEGGSTRVRSRSRDALVDLREMSEVAPLFQPFAFLRVHREFAVNLARVARVRRRPSGRDWEGKMEPPVNRVIPVARDALSALWEAFGESG